MWIATLLADFRHAFRVLRNSPGFTTVAVLSLALGIGANTAIFTLLNAVVLRELPVPNPHELVMFGPGIASGVTGGLPSRTPQLFSLPFYRELVKSQQGFKNLAALNSMGQRVYARFGAGSLEPFKARVVSGNYFATLEVSPQIGRTLSPSDDGAPGGSAVAVLSDSYWKRRWGRDRSVVGKSFTAGNAVYTIIGVAAPGFFGTKMGEAPDMWFPMSMQHQIFSWLDNLNDSMSQSSYLIGRLRPGVSAVAAASPIDAFYHRFMWEASDAATRARDDGSFGRTHITLESAARGFSNLRQQFALPLQILIVVASMVLLIACANLANLLLARAAARRQEFAVRLAVGAGRQRLIQQLLAESLLLAFAGGTAGVLVAIWGSQGLLQMISTGPLILPLDIAPDERVFAFTFGISLLTGVVFGLVPALRATQVDPNTSLKSGKGAAGVQRPKLGGVLVGAQIMLSLVLLVSAGLFTRTIYNLSSVSTGFSQSDVLLVEFEPAFSGYSDKDSRLPAVYERIEERLKTVPGVRAAGLSNLAFGPSQWTTDVEPVSTSVGRKSSGANVVTPGYFDANGIPILSGRGLRPSDSAKAPKVAVVNETFARYFFPGESAIGRRFRNDEFGAVQIVGVAKDGKYVDLREEPRRMVFFPVAQIPQYIGLAQVRVSGDPGAVIPAIRGAMAEAEPNFPIVSITTVSEGVSRTILRERLTATLSTAFSVIALLLACIGLYGVLSYNVARRTGEIGIRMALGARARNVITMVLRETVFVVFAGFVVGVPAIVVMARFVKSLLYGVEAVDWLTIAAAIALLLTFAILASYFPARRAAKVDPMIALRYE